MQKIMSSLFILLSLRTRQTGGILWIFIRHRKQHRFPELLKVNVSSSIQSRLLNVLETYTTNLSEANPVTDWKIKEYFIYGILNPESKIMCRFSTIGGLLKNKEKAKYNTIQRNIIPSFPFQDLVCKSHTGLSQGTEWLSNQAPVALQTNTSQTPWQGKCGMQKYLRSFHHSCTKQ